MGRYAEVVFNLPVRKSFAYELPANAPSTTGFRVSAPFGKRKLTGLVIAEMETPPAGVKGIKQIARVVDSRAVFNEQVLELSRWISRMYMCSLGEALSAMIPGGRREAEADELPPEEHLRDYELAAQQRDAVKTIIEKGAGSFYLFGVTGSGKTDVFIEVAREVVSRG
ncbi:MAG TPA: primosomal protein N', partial [Spirochaetia bacterium]|nr:primosomal protein N' [Spirochaetia bacterium]